MKNHPRLLSLIVLLALVTMSSTSLAGLYGDPGKDQVSGDLNSQDYWWTRFDDMMLDSAIQQHEPEGRIGIDLASAASRRKDLAAKYPKHEGIKKMNAHADEIASKIDDNADRSRYFGPECPWDESNFAQLWVNLHWAQTAYQEKDYYTARFCLQNVEQNYQFMLAPDRMKNYPPELRQWVIDNKPVADKLYAEVKSKQS